MRCEEKTEWQEKVYFALLSPIALICSSPAARANKRRSSTRSKAMDTKNGKSFVNHGLKILVEI